MPKILAPPAIRVVTKRFLAAAAQAAPKADAPSLNPQTEKLSNGLIVSTIDTGSPVATISLTARAGARYETADNLGVTHSLRALAGKRTQNTTEVTLTRHIEQIGGTLSCSNSRDTITYTVQCLRDKIDVGLRYVAETALEGVFWPWEIKDNAWRLTHDRALLANDPSAQLVEALHKAAYRNTGLANSLYAPQYTIGIHTQDQLRDYVAKNMTLSRAALTATGCDHSAVVELANRLTSGDAAVTDAASAYGGGEVREDTGTKYSYVAVAGKGAGLEDGKGVLALALLQRVLGVGSRIPHGSGAGSHLGGVAAAAAGDSAVAVSALSMNYLNSGLFGFSVAVDAAKAGPVVTAVIKEMRKLSSIVTEGALARAKTALKVDLLTAAAGGEGATCYMAAAALSSGTVPSAANVSAAIDAITVADVTSAGKAALESKASIAVVGNTRAVPYLDSI